MTKVKYVALAGSARTALKRSKALSKQEEGKLIDVTLRLRSKRSSKELDDLVAAQAALPPRQRSYLTREALEEGYGADPADVFKVEQFAHAHGLTVTNVHLSSRVMHVRGSVNVMRAAFKATLRTGAVAGRTYRVREGTVSVPATLKSIIVGVHGLDNRPVARPHLRRRAHAASSSWPVGSLSVAEIVKAYNFPIEFDGSGQSIALIELNGIDENGRAIDTGYKTSDLQSFFKASKLAMPDISAVGVDGGANLPGRPDGGDDEVVLDIEVAAAAAPKARIVVYFAPNTSSGFINAIKAAVHDKVRKPSVVSVSWGGTEDPGGHLAKPYLDALNEALRDAAAVGVTVCISSGDDGSADMAADEWDGKPHVDFPASSPHALACGGTRLGLSQGTVKDEVVWNEGRKNGAGGGGVSNYFALPAYQAGQSVPRSPKKFKGRGVPDLAANADPVTGYRIVLNGKKTALGGTSAVAPLVAGLLARINQRLAKSGATAGFINPMIYGSAKAAFRDIVQGDNDINGDLGGSYAAGTGWDACTGLGVADGRKLLALLSK